LPFYALICVFVSQLPELVASLIKAEWIGWIIRSSRVRTGRRARSDVEHLRRVVASARVS
jgi:hypothetical protein